MTLAAIYIVYAVHSSRVCGCQEVVGGMCIFQFSQPVQPARAAPNQTNAGYANKS